MNTKHRKLFNALWLLAATLVSSASPQEASKTKPEQESTVVSYLRPSVTGWTSESVPTAGGYIENAVFLGFDAANRPHILFSDSNDTTRQMHSAWKR